VQIGVSGGVGGGGDGCLRRARGLRGLNSLVICACKRARTAAKAAADNVPSLRSWFAISNDNRACATVCIGYLRAVIIIRDPATRVT